MNEFQLLEEEYGNLKSQFATSSFKKADARVTGFLRGGA